jgi:hypothetical protein
MWSWDSLTRFDGMRSYERLANSTYRARSEARSMEKFLIQDRRLSALALVGFEKAWGRRFTWQRSVGTARLYKLLKLSSFSSDRTSVGNVGVHLELAPCPGHRETPAGNQHCTFCEASWKNTGDQKTESPSLLKANEY